MCILVIILVHQGGDFVAVRSQNVVLAPTKVGVDLAREQGIL